MGKGWQVILVLAASLSLSLQDDGLKTYCPGMRLWCPSTQKCCPSKFHHEGYLCCPFRDGVCCDNSLFCCGRNHICTRRGCQAADGSIVNGTVLTRPHLPPTENLRAPLALEDSMVAIGEAQLKKLALLAKALKIPYPTCGGTALCTGSKCCPIIGNKGEAVSYTCCPYGDKAVCCDMWCCPEGAACGDPALQLCVRPAVGDKVQVIIREVKNYTCPESLGPVCAPDQTCCVGPDKHYTCAPFRAATCCSDGVHSCPAGYLCDDVTNVCKPGPGDIMAGIEPRLVLEAGLVDPLIEEDSQISNEIGAVGDVLINGSEDSEVQGTVGNIRCDNMMECHDGQTCCRLTDGSFGCCPFPKAICCSDHVHCCPHDMWCDHSTHKCKPRLEELIETSLMTSEDVQSVECGDGSLCPDGMSCCGTGGGKFGCCPFPEAICCSDNQHCCPGDTVCNLEEGTCYGANNPLLAMKIPAMRSDNEYPDVIPMGVKFPSRLPDTLPMRRKYPSLMRNVTEAGKETTLTSVRPSGEQTTLSTNSLTCNDGTVCASDSTCCLLSDGYYGCCPMPHAVCCEDGIHCCQHGYKCDMAHFTCIKPTPHIPTYELAGKKKVTCEDETLCPTDTTCCLIQSGRFGCCPFTEASCCVDREHCCPKGYNCNIVTETCDRAIIGEIAPVDNINSLVCPDATKCPDGMTCCPSEASTYACCPLSDAVCCANMHMCCPHGFTCNEQVGTCERSGYLPRFMSPLPAPVSIPVETVEMGVIDGEQNEETVRCDDGSRCPTGATCCQLDNNVWGCCPWENAQCCDDKKHCCPNGFTCDTGSGTCAKSPPSSGVATSVGISSRPTPLDAQPRSAPLDAQPRSAPLDAQPRSAPLDAQPRSASLDTECGDSTTCPESTTCCKLASAQWGCCNYARATCCADGTTCCPEGFTCDPEHGTCEAPDLPTQSSSLIGPADLPTQSSSLIGPADLPTQSSSLIGPADVQTQASSVISASEDEVVNDGDFSGMPLKPTSGGNEIPEVPDLRVFCKNGDWCANKCCFNSTGQWGCCPYENGVCCANGKSCCKKGQQCDAQGNCLTNTTETNLAGRQCPDKSMCPRDATCCSITTSKYACCRYRDANCCSDGLHCCPSGWSCDLPNSRCIQAETGRFMDLSGNGAPLCTSLLSCGNGKYCPSDMRCLGLFGMCYSLQTLSQQTMIADCT